MRLFYTLLLSFITLYANDYTSVLKAEENQIELKAHQSLEAGSVVYISRVFDTQHETIIKRCDVRKVKEQFFADCDTFSYLEQPSLTQIVTEVKAGDRVYINLLDERVMLIAPNQESYLNYKREHKNYTYLHSDIFALKLYDMSHPIPSREDFITFCKEESLEHIIVLFKQEAKHVNCYNFRLNKSEKFTLKNDTFNRPFYHRINEITKSVFNFSDENIENFETYYTSLIKE